MTNRLASSVTKEAASCIDYGLNKIQHCLNQLDEGQVWWRPEPNMNSIGNLLLHLAGNVRQWIVAGVGDLEDTRLRRQEFAERDELPKGELLQSLVAVLDEAKRTMEAASESDLLTETRIQGHDVTKLGAIWHSVTHFQGHVQEIIGMTRQQLGDDYVFEWSPSSPEEGA